MGQATSLTACGSVEACAISCQGNREKITASGSQELQEKTYVTARADVDTALPISVRSELPTVRQVAGLPGEATTLQAIEEHSRQRHGESASTCSKPTIAPQEVCRFAQHGDQNCVVVKNPATVALPPPPKATSSCCVAFEEATDVGTDVTCGHAQVNASDLPNLLLLSERVELASLEHHEDIGVLLSQLGKQDANVTDGPGCVSEAEAQVEDSDIDASQRPVIADDRVVATEIPNLPQLTKHESKEHEVVGVLLSPSTLADGGVVVGPGGELQIATGQEDSGSTPSQQPQGTEMDGRAAVVHARVAETCTPRADSGSALLEQPLAAEVDGSAVGPKETQEIEIPGTDAKREAESAEPQDGAKNVAVDVRQGQEAEERQDTLFRSLLHDSKGTVSTTGAATCCAMRASSPAIGAADVESASVDRESRAVDPSAQPTDGLANPTPLQEESGFDLSCSRSAEAKTELEATTEKVYL
eukprot:TRINITY_DN9055_c0_g1_i1.p1 TRINITY_DN9055_c0_g1~~TRINITY_DN9055_c0_g1_i1.p1  ORF type:complete len:474 (-),score=88.56 TRINITY_DN9055_c0_g1_i1:245-1666(-)